MKGKVNCTCGWSWNKSDSSKKDMYICHECGRDNSNNMKNGGWLDNYNDSQASAPEGMVGDGFSNVGRNYSPAWGGQFEEGGEIPNAQKGKKVKYVESKNDPRYKAYNDSLNSYNTGNKVLNKLKTILENNQKGISGYENENNNYSYATTDYIKNPYKKPDYGSNKKGTSPKGQGKDLEKWIKKELDPVNWKSQLPIAEALKELDKNNVLPFRSISSAELPTISIYKKPEEEVIVQRPQEQSIQNNLQPIGIQNDFNLEAPLPQIRQQVIQPKYYDVEDYTQGSANYIGEQTNYRTSDLSTLSEQSPNNKRKITPRYQDGGKTFLQPTSDKLPEGYRIPYDTPSTERAGSIGGENGEPAYLVPEFKYGHPIYDPIEEFKRTGEHLGGPFKTWQEAEEWEETVRHPAVENRETIMFPQEKFAMGGSIPGSVGFTYARTKGIPSEGPYAKKTMPSAQNGADMYGNPILADLKYDQSVNRTNYNPRTNQMIFGHDMPLFISQEQRDKTLAHENRHAWQFANDRTNFNMVHNPEHAFQDRLQKRPEMMSTDEVFEKYHNRKQKETEMDVKAFKGNNPQFSFMPNEMVYKKFVDHMQYNNPNSVEGEAQYYENTGKKSFKNGGWLDGYDVAQNGKKKFKLKDERLQGIRPSESTFVKKPNFDAQQSKVQKTYVDQVGKQMAEEKRRAKLTKDQREREDYNARNEERGSFQAHVPESTWDKTKAIVSNPLTAFGYVARNESLPARFQHGERNNLDYALDWVNPLQGAASASNIPGQLGRGEFLDAGLSALDAIDLGVYAKGAMKASKPFFQKAGQQLGNISTSIAPELRQELRTAGPLFGKKVSEHVMGLGQGIEDIVKGRPIFETFPITSAQKQASNIAQDRALQEGVDFAENWFYKNGQIRQSVRNKIDDISVSEPNAKMNDYRYNPFLSTQNKLVSSRSGDLPFENISDEAKEYIQNRRGQIGGVNMGDTQESITLRNMGMYRLPPQQIKNTVVHESAHTAQDIGDYVPWGTMTTEFSPNLKYFTSNPNTNIGQRFKNALRTPRKPSGDTYAHRTWQSSPNELHSELMSARSQLYDKFLKEGKSAEEAIDLLQNPGDETLDALNKIGGLDQFFKQDIWGKSKVPTQTKRDLMRILPAAVPVAVGAGALQQQKEGGVIKDDRGQWDHPGEITEIGSNEITMEGVPYDVLGVSDTGDTKLMKPGKNYKFKGKKVTEFPMAKNGLRQEQKGLQNLDNLTNFTNYNKPQPGSWLEKYN